MNIMNINVSSFYYSVSNMLFLTYKLITCWLVITNKSNTWYFLPGNIFFYGVPLWYITGIKDFLGSDVIERVWVCMNEMADISCAFIIWFDLLLLDKSFCCSICDSIIIWSQANIVIKFLFKNLTFKQQTDAHAFLIISRAFE